MRVKGPPWQLLKRILPAATGGHTQVTDLGGWQNFGDSWFPASVSLLCQIRASQVCSRNGDDCNWVDLLEQLEFAHGPDPFAPEEVQSAKCRSAKKCLTCSCWKIEPNPPIYPHTFYRNRKWGRCFLDNFGLQNLLPALPPLVRRPVMKKGGQKELLW